MFHSPAGSAIAALSLSVVLTGCSRSSAPAPAAAPAAAPATPASGTGTVEGKVPTPAPGASVVVVLEPKTPRTFPAQDEIPVMDQVGQTFSPALLIVRTGQPVRFRNSDDTLHNVNVKEEGTRVQAFNVAIPTDGIYEHTFPHDGFYRVGCDIHPAMAASLFAATTPFVTLAERDGTFWFADVPIGAWKMTVWAAGRKLEREVDVKAGAMQLIEIMGIELNVHPSQSAHLLGTHRRHAFLVLQDAIHDQKRLLDDHEPVAREQIRADDDVGDAGFVLEGEEHEALRRPWTLARDDHAGHAHAPPLPRGP